MISFSNGYLRTNAASSTNRGVIQDQCGSSTLLLLCRFRGAASLPAPAMSLRGKGRLRRSGTHRSLFGSMAVMSKLRVNVHLGL